MDTYENRRLALINAMHSRSSGKQVKLAEQLGIRPDYVSRMLSSGPNSKRISGDFAREIEKKLALPPLWMDQPQSAGSTAMVPATKANVASVPVLQHKHHPAPEDFWGVPMFVSDVERAGRKIEHLCAAIVTDGGMACCSGMRDYVAVVDVASRIPTDGDVYLVDHGNRLKLRRMMLDGKRWIGRSDANPGERYPDVEIDDPEQQVIGKFVWGGGFVL